MPALMPASRTLSSRYGSSRYRSPVAALVALAARKALVRRLRLGFQVRRASADTRGRMRSTMLSAVALLAVLAFALQGCDVVPGPVNIKIADPSPTVKNSTTFSYPGYQSPSGRALSVAVSKNGQRVYVSTPRGGLWRSDDSGGSWEQLTGPEPGDNTRTCVDADPRCVLPISTIADVYVSPDNPGLVFAAAAADNRSQSLDGIYRSSDGGTTWTLVFQLTCGGVAHDVTAITPAPDDSTRLWAAGPCGVAYTTTDSSQVGGSWAMTSMPDGGPVYAVAASEATNGARDVYACGPGSVYVSFDNGHSFTKDGTASSALPHNACAAPDFAGGRSSAPAAIAVAPGHPDQVYVAAESGGNGPVYFLDSLANGSACDPSTLDCGGSLWMGNYSGSSASAIKSSWQQLPSPPVYEGPHTTTNSGSVAVSTRKMAAGGYLVLFLDENTVNVAVGQPTAGGWHRLDGPNASTLAQSGATLGSDAARPFDPIHANPRAVALTQDFGLSLQPGAASSAAFNHNTDLASCAGGSLLLVSDGGFYRTADCGQTWQQANNLETLGAYMLAGLPRPKSSNAYKLPAVYFGTPDNHDWYSMDGGLNWGGGDDLCSSCAGYWSDPVRGDLVVHPMPEEGLRVYVGLGGDAPDLYNSRTLTGAGFPATLGLLTPAGYTIPAAQPYFDAATDAVAGWRPLVETLSGQKASGVDLAMVAPASTPAAAPSPGNSDDLVVWRKQTLVAGTDGWASDGAVLPPGATILQAAGGHTNPTYYVGDRAPGPDGSLFDMNQQGDHLYRSHRASSGTLDGWDCIVPGPAHPGTHDGQCESSSNSVTRAYAFASDPYDAKVVYIADTDGVKLSTDGGATWQKVQSLSDWLSEGGRIGAQCAAFCGDSMLASHTLTSIEFVPDEPKMRFATGLTGVFFTNDGSSANGTGEDWHRLLDTSATGCVPQGTFFDKANTVGRAIYVACAGRSLLSFVGLPSPGDSLNYTLNGGGQYPYPPVLSASSPTPTTAPSVTTPAGPGYAIDFRVVPKTDYTQSCASGLQPMTFKLDNTRSGGPVDWQLTITDTDPSGQPWTAFSAQSGTVKQGETSILTLSPKSNVCPDMSSHNVASKTYTAVLKYTGGKQVVLSDAVSTT